MEILLRPIGYVRGGRSAPIDDGWDAETCTIELDHDRFAPSALEGLDAFSHVEVVYHLSSFTFPGRRFTLKVVLPRWKNDTPGELPEVPTVTGVWAAASRSAHVAIDAEEK